LVRSEATLRSLSEVLWHALAIFVTEPESVLGTGVTLVRSLPIPLHRLSVALRIATGTVVVRDLIGSGAAQEQAVVGETPNLAARLQGIAEPNTVVIAESTRRLLGNLFELEDLGAKDLKGISGPVPAWAAVRPGSVESRFEALRTADDAASRSRRGD
jgi:class 3 adenylate cyclase